jgi:hypothetical protein
MYALVVGVAALLFAYWLVSLISVLKNPDRYRNATQLIWVLVILFAGPLGALLYQCLGPVRTVSAGPPEVVPDRRARSEAIANPWADAEPR